MTPFLCASHPTDERRDKQPAVLQHGQQRVPDHVLDVVTEPVGTCRVETQRAINPSGVVYFVIRTECFLCVSSGRPRRTCSEASRDESKGEEVEGLNVQGNQAQS